MSVRGGQTDPWRITAEERAKHDGQFSQLNPVGGFITGDQAKGFLLLSKLPPAVLGQIWGLADMNADGKMDKKEFSIAMHLIQKKLQGFDLPKVLPPSLKADPVSSVPAYGSSSASQTSGFGTASPWVPPNSSSSVRRLRRGDNTGHIARERPVSFSSLPSSSFNAAPQVDPKTRSGTFSAPTPIPSTQSSPTVGDNWGIPQSSRLRFNQLFNSHDRMRRGFILGSEARGILIDSGLPQPTLAQIWNLSDIDNDGKLTSDEFCVAMFLVELAKSGQQIPAALPPNLIPPAYRRERKVSLSSPGTGNLGISGMPPPPAPPSGGQPRKESFSDLLGGLGGTSQQQLDLLKDDTMVTFEDKRKENFEKGQAELERRRALLREQQKAEQEARLAAERAEQEKRERIRQEQERKKQQELEKHMQRQRELEQEREEQRRKALEQREAARRELERQRQLEWERQRLEQLVTEKHREQEQVLQLKSQATNMTCEVEKLDAKKKDIGQKVNQARTSVNEITSAIERMRQSRDIKLSDIERLQINIQEYNQKLIKHQQEKEELTIKSQTSTQSNPISDTYKTVKHSHGNKQISIQRLKMHLEQLEKDTAVKLEEIDSNNSVIKDLNNEISTVQQRIQKLKQTIEEKQKKAAQEKIINAAEPVKKVTEEKKPAPVDNWFNSFSGGDAFGSSSTDAFGGGSTDAFGGGSTDAFGGSSTDMFGGGTTTNNIDLFASTTTATTTSSQDKADSWADFMANTTTSQASISTSQGIWGDVFSTSTTVATSAAVTAGSFDDVPAAVDTTPTDTKPTFGRYRALYPFDSRNPDELSLQPGDIVMVSNDQTGAEPGWMGGEMNGKSGWFPASYVEAIEDNGVDSAKASSSKSDDSHFTFSSVDDSKFAFTTSVTAATPEADSAFAEEKFSLSGSVPGESSTDGTTAEPAPLDDTQLPLTQSEQSSFMSVVPTNVSAAPSPTPGQGQTAPDGLQAQAVYPWRAKKDNHLTFNKGDVINVKEQQDIWWSGELGGKVGWFPKSYVKLVGGATKVPESDTPVSAQTDKDSAIDSAKNSPAFDNKTETATGEYYVALYNYSSTEAGDLAFNQGDVITVTKAEGDWWTGTLNDQSGIFPGNYVKKMETQPGVKLTKKPEIASVIAAYTATGPEQLSLVPGQLISVRKKSPSGWWEGELQARGQKRKIGWFPANYVKMLGSSSARSTPVQSELSSSLADHRSLTPQPQSTFQTSTVTVEQVMSLYPYTAQNSDELTFQKGAILNVLSKEDNDWWRGELNGVEGVFPSNYVKPLNEIASSPLPSWNASPDVLLTTSPLEKKRQNHICELINTEETYVEDMSFVMEVFYTPLLESKTLTEEELEMIFVNWKELLVCNTKLLKALRVRKKMSGEGQAITVIGDILCESLPHLTPYIRFCSCQLKAAALLQHKTEQNPVFKEACKQCVTDPRTKGMPISSFLLKPMQRVCKYPLLISKILEYTPENHPDHQNLVDSLAKAEELCSQVNEGVREKDNSDKLEWIQLHVQCEGLPEKLTFNSITNCLGPRKFIYSGNLTKVKSGKVLVGFLFNDFLLLCIPIGSSSVTFSFDSKAKLRMYKTPIFLNEVTVRLPSETESGDGATFLLSHIDRVYSLKAGSSTERDNWVKHIDEQSKNYLAIERKKRERAHSLRKIPAIGRLLVVVLEGVDLMPCHSNASGKSDPYCEISMGSQEHKTKVINATLNPKWNSSMQFTIKDVEQDVLCISVFDQDLFTPNDFLGRTEVRVKDIQKETKEKRGPVTKRLTLHEVETGEVIVKLDLQLYGVDQNDKVKTLVG